MKTLTSEQFRKQFGETGIASFDAQPKIESNYFSKVAEGIKENVKEASESLTASAEGRMNPLAAGANIAKNVSGAVLTPVSVALKPIFDKTVTPISEAIVGTAPAQRLIDVLSKNPELVGAVADTLETGLNVAGIEGTIATLKGGVNFVKGKIKDIGYEPPGPDGGGGGDLETLANETSAGIMNRVARLNPTEETAFSKIAGKTPGEYLKETGNFGAPDKIIKTESAKFIESKNTVDTEFAKLPGVYQNGAILDALNGLLEKAKSVSTKSVKSPYLSQVQELLSKYKSGGLTMEEINIVKRLYERNVKLGYNKLLNADKVEQATNIDNAIRKWQVKQAEELGFKNVGELNKQTQISKFLVDKLGNKIIGQSALNSVSLTDWIVISGGDVSSIAGFLTKRFLSAKSVQAKIAEILNSKEIKGTIKANVSPTIESSLRQAFPKGTLPGLPAGKAPGASINVPIESLPKSSIEPSATNATRTTINPKTGDVYIRDAKTGKIIRIIPKNK